MIADKAPRRERAFLQPVSENCYMPYSTLRAHDAQALLLSAFEDLM